MSSILEALREIEGSRAPETQAADAWEDRPRTGRRIVAALALVVAVGAIGAAAFLRSRRTASTAPVDSTVVAALPPAAPAPAPPAAALDADPPRAQVAPPPAATSAAPTPARPITRVAARPRSRRAGGPPRPAGEPRIDISAISFAGRAESRTVTLSIDGSVPVTLHEGESAGPIDVQLIEPDGIYVRHAGQIFAVQAD